MSARELKRYEELKKEIKEHNVRYYEDDAPSISDFEYDILLREFSELEKKHPEWRSEDSPTQTVGGPARRSMKKVTHRVAMQSLQDYFSESELAVFVERVWDELKAGQETALLQEPAFSVEEKIDGLSVSLEYLNGRFFRASTRGDGRVGEDITANMLAFKELPLSLKEAVPLLEVRAEVYMSNESFERLNEQQRERGEKIFANPRNAAAGSLRQLDPAITAERGLSFFVFNIQGISGKEFSTHLESLEYLKQEGFPVIKSYPCSALDSSVHRAVSDIAARRANLPYGIDGAVVKVNSLAARAFLGENIKTPRWAAAYKYPAETQETKLLRIDIQVGRTGKLTPLAILEPVLVAGSTISKATLHNEDYIKDKDIRSGDFVYIQKAGDVIPAVVSVNLDKRDPLNHPFIMPQQCPVCSAPVARVEGEAATYCTSATCPAQGLRHLEHFASRDNMNIEGLGEKTLAQFFETGWIKSIADVYRLNEKRTAMLELPGFKETSVDKLLASIEKSKNCSLEKFIASLGILHIGTAAARSLAERFGSMESLMEAREDDLMNVPDIGEITAKSIVAYFNVPENRQLLKELSDLGVQPTHEPIEKSGTGLNGLNFVITGRLPKLSRAEAGEIIRRAGGSVSESVSKKTSFLLLGEDAGSKADKAARLGIPSLTEADLLKMVGEH